MEELIGLAGFIIGGLFLTFVAAIVFRYVFNLNQIITNQQVIIKILKYLAEKEKGPQA